jgi:probable addiction module antidote protein
MSKTSETITEFDLSDYLDSDEAISEYLTQVLDDGDMNEFLKALSYIAKAKGMSEVSKESGLSRPSLYKMLSSDAKPRFETVLKVLETLDIKLEAKVG